MAEHGLAQVHYHADGNPWNQKAESGPDAVVDGWYYNLGITGLRVELVADAPKELVVRHVFSETPAAGNVRVGDHILGVGGKPFSTAHRNGYGMELFGPDGPIFEFAQALESCQAESGSGSLALSLRRGDAAAQAKLEIGKGYGSYASGFPADCEKSSLIRAELCAYLVETQAMSGSWGSPPQDLFAPLALLAHGDPAHRAAVERSAHFHARTTSAEDESWLIHWRYMAAAIVLAEWAHATEEEWVLPELEQIYALLHRGQYVNMAQVNPKTRETHPGSWPQSALDSHGGWGHNPGFEGYGPIAMLTGQGALALAMMERLGVQVDGERHRAAYAFLERATGPNHYVWYEDSVAGAEDWADMGRTGAAGLAFHLCSFDKEESRRRALGHARIIGAHPESFPDTHGSPIIGMGFAAMAAHVDAGSWRKLMDANRWWFTLAQCADGTFYYQPNRDNAGYGGDSRVQASAVTALMLGIAQGNLMLTKR